MTGIPWDEKLQFLSVVFIALSFYVEMLATYGCMQLHFLHFHFVLTCLRGVGWQPTILEQSWKIAFLHFHLYWQVLGVWVGGLRFWQPTTPKQLHFLHLHVVLTGLRGVGWQPYNSWAIAFLTFLLCIDRCRLATCNSWALHFLHCHFALTGLRGAGWQPIIPGQLHFLH